VRAVRANNPLDAAFVVGGDAKVPRVTVWS